MILTVKNFQDISQYPTPSDILFVETKGYYAIGDGGGALYERVSSAPANGVYAVSATGGIFSLKASVTINIRQFGAKCDGVTDDAAAIRAAITYCESFTPPLPLSLSTGSIKINSTLPIAKTGFHLHGLSSGVTTIVPGVTNGTPVIEISNGVNEWRLSGFEISAPINYSNFDAGTANAQNCIGIRAVDAAGDYPTRFTIDDVHVYGCATGVKLTGFIFWMSNCSIQRCDLGLDLTTCNAALIAAIHLEFNRKSFSVSDSDGIHFDNLLDEGVVANPLASTIDDCNGITFTSPYIEYGNTYAHSQPFWVFGGATQCSSVKIEASRIACSGAMAAGTPAIKLDRVEGASVSGSIADGVGKLGVETTANCKNITIETKRDFGFLQDASKNISRGYNYFANSNFDLWLRGWEAVVPTQATISKETTVVRRGANALKVQANAAVTNAYCQFKLIGPQVVEMRGKSMRLAAWMFVPDIVEYTTDAWTAYPGITLQSYNGSVTTTSNTVNNKALRNAWNFIDTELTVQSDATEIYINLFANQSSNTTSGNEYLIFDSVSICESAVGIFRQSRGEYVDSPLIPSGISGRMIFFSDVAPTDTNQIFAVGDQVWKLTPTAGASPGWVCTTAGAGGTAVFKATAALAA